MLFWCFQTTSVAHQTYFSSNFFDVTLYYLLGYELMHLIKVIYD